MKAILTVILCFLLEISSLFGGAGGKTTPPSVDSPALYDDDEIVTVIIELETSGLLEGVTNSEQRKQLVENFIGSEKYEKILDAQETAKGLIKKLLPSVNFDRSFSYSFAFDGLSLDIPYKYVDDIEALPGVKSVNVSAAFAQPDAMDGVDGDRATLEKAGGFTGVPEARELGFTGKGMVVAILDTGFELTHEAFDFEVDSPRLSKSDIDLMTTFKALNTIVPRWGVNYYSQKIPYKWDYAEIDKTVENQYSGHGTHVAGIIGGKSDRITGVAPDAQFLCMKVFGDEEGSLAKEYVNLAALDDAIKLGADVVNMSLGTPSGQDPDNIFTWDVLRRLEKAGVSVVCSAGNEASMGDKDATAGSTTVNADLFDYGTVGSPASYEWCMAVASSMINSRTSASSDVISVGGLGSVDISSFSSWGTTSDMKLKPEITAPGSSILSSVPGNSYAYYSGTSMASPYYAGSFAIVKQYLAEKYPNLGKKQTAELVNNILMSTATVFRGYGKSAVYSPRRQGAGFVNLEGALSTKAYLTQADGVSRPKLELGEDADGTLEMSFVIHNMSGDPLAYNIDATALTDSYSKSGDIYINTLTSRKLYKNTHYTLEYTEGVNDDGTVVVAANSEKKISLKITYKDSILDAQKNAFKNGFFLDGFVTLKANGDNATLSIPFMAFYGDWDAPMLFDNTMYDSRPSYLGKQWGLMVTDGSTYYPLGANMFENGTESGVDRKYCAFSKNALSSKLKKPYVTVSVGLLRNGKRMDYNLFSSAGIFRYCGSTLFEYSRKTNNPDKSNIGKLWGGGGLINGNGYVYKVSTTPANYPGGRTTIEFPFVVDNDAAKIKSATYETVNGENILKIEIEDNRYVMGFQAFTKDDKSIGKASFKGVDPVDGVYKYEMNVSKAAGNKFSASDLETVKLYVVDYAYNETFGSVSLSSDGVDDAAISTNALAAPISYDFEPQQPVVEVDTQAKTEKTNPFLSYIDKLIAKLKAVV